MKKFEAEDLAHTCSHCGGELETQVNPKEKVHPYRVLCKSCGVQSAWHGSPSNAWASLTRRVQPAKSWRCFHCDEVFVNEHFARLHFGQSQEVKPACLIAAEVSLLEQYRRVEDELAMVRWQLLQEDTEAARAHYGHMARHASALVHAEQIGYDKGLADGKALGTGGSPA